MSAISKANSETLIQNDGTMRYRPLGKTGLMVSALSFGCMRLTEDMTLNEKLISSAIDLGVNYFETTRGYCSGKCQHRTSPGLVGKTSGVIVSGKGSMNADTTAYNFRKEMETQLDILGLSHFKFYQVGWFGWDRMPHLLKPGGVLDALRKAKDEGLVQHIGFTGHDKPENFIKCIETGLFDCITVPYNMLNRSYEPTLTRAGELGVGVVAMCPIGGGLLASESSKLQDGLGIDLPTSEMALRFVLSNPNVSTACSGMSTMEMLQQNVKTVNNFDPDEDADFEDICEGLDRMRETLGERFCTACGYCMPCPEGIHIPYMMELHTNGRVFGLEKGVSNALAAFPQRDKILNCSKCRSCEKACPNQLEICETIEKMAELLG